MFTGTHQCTLFWANWIQIKPIYSLQYFFGRSETSTSKCFFIFPSHSIWFHFPNIFFNRNHRADISLNFRNAVISSPKASCWIVTCGESMVLLNKM